MTKKQILETITQQEQAAWATYRTRTRIAIAAGTREVDLPVSVTDAEEKWATLYCLLEKVQQ